MHYNLVRASNAKTLTFFLQDSSRKIGSDILFFLKEQLKNSSMVRICLHQDSAATTQMMLIAITPDALIEPHKNIFKDKIYSIVEGEMLFEQTNEDAATLCAGEIYVLRKDSFAKMSTKSDVCIYQEIIAGPFDPKDTVYA